RSVGGRCPNSVGQLWPQVCGDPEARRRQEDRGHSVPPVVVDRGTDADLLDRGLARVAGTAFVVLLADAVEIACHLDFGVQSLLEELPCGTLPQGREEDPDRGSVDSVVSCADRAGVFDLLRACDFLDRY